MKLPWLALASLVVLSVASVLTAENAVSPSRAAQLDTAIGPNDVKPPECSSINLTSKVAGSGIIVGTADPDLVSGSSADDTIDGAGGDDCIVGGAGADTINGSGGSDVCIGGAGTDVFDPDCETVYQ